MNFEYKPCSVCGKHDCKRYGNVVITGEITKDGQEIRRKEEDYTITECELKEISKKLGQAIYLV